MEFLPGAFDREWERRRVALLHEMQRGQSETFNWDEPRRAGVARLPNEHLGGLGRTRSREDRRKGLWALAGAGIGGRSMRTRFAALAHGSQPAVVKLASYGGGARAGAMLRYTARGGELAAENERGERILGKDALCAQREEWQHLFDNRAASRDLGVFCVMINGAALASGADRDQQIREILRLGFGDRRYVYAVQETDSLALDVSGVVVLRARDGKRLTGDRKAAGIVQQRYDESATGQGVEARFHFHGYGNGVEWGTARVRGLVARSESDVRDEAGRLIDNAEHAGDLVQKDWRKALHSRKGRDVMHLIVSARAGTNATAFGVAVRDFLGDQFAGHRYMFAVHDPTFDPKEMDAGGRRPHIHAHAIVTMRSEAGGRIETNPRVFREWRSLMSEKARQQGINMELTDRRELASAPAYTRNQVRPVSYRGRTEHEGASDAARARYEAKRSNEPNRAGSHRSKAYAAVAAGVWADLANEQQHGRIRDFASLQKSRLEALERGSQYNPIIDQIDVDATKNDANMVLVTQPIEGKEDQMREMTRPEFHAYENRVEAVLTSVEQTLESSDRNDFDEVAKAAREVVDIRRDYLDFMERQAEAEPEPARGDNGDERNDDANAQWDAAVSRHGVEVVEAANEVLIQVEYYREGLDRVEAGELPRYFAASYQAGLVREVHRAAEIAVNDDNQYMREVAKSDQDLQRAIEVIEATREETRSAQDGTDRQATGGEPSAGVSTGVAEAEQGNQAVYGRFGVGQSEQIGDRQASPPEEQPPQHPDEKVADRRSMGETEIAGSDPPQQHVPRLRQIELEIEGRDDRDRDNRGR